MMSHIVGDYPKLYSPGYSGENISGQNFRLGGDDGKRSNCFLFPQRWKNLDIAV